MKRFPAIAVWVAVWVFGGGLVGNARAENSDPIFLMHITSLAAVQERFNGIPATALAALDEGYAVSMIFDGPAVKVSKLGAWYGGDTTILDKMPIPEATRRVMGEKLGVSPGSFPDNHGDLLRFLRGRGVKLYVSQEMMIFYNIAPEKADQVFVPVGPDEMVRILASADVYVSY